MKEGVLPALLLLLHLLPCSEGGLQVLTFSEDRMALSVALSHREPIFQHTWRSFVTEADEERVLDDPVELAIERLPSMLSTCEAASVPWWGHYSQGGIAIQLQQIGAVHNVYEYYEYDEACGVAPNPTSQCREHSLCCIGNTPRGVGSHCLKRAELYGVYALQHSAVLQHAVRVNATHGSMVFSEELDEQHARVQTAYVDASLGVQSTSAQLDEISALNHYRLLRPEESRETDSQYVPGEHRHVRAYNDDREWFVVHQRSDIWEYANMTETEWMEKSTCKQQRHSTTKTHENADHIEDQFWEARQHTLRRILSVPDNAAIEWSHESDASTSTLKVPFPDEDVSNVVIQIEGVTSHPAVMELPTQQE